MPVLGERNRSFSTENGVFSVFEQPLSAAFLSRLKDGKIFAWPLFNAAVASHNCAGVSPVGG